MTATILEPTVVETIESEEDDNIIHFVCHCHNAAISWCGKNVSDLDFGDFSEMEDCPVCVLAADLSFPKCPWGCRCAHRADELDCDQEFH